MDENGDKASDYIAGLERANKAFQSSTEGLKQAAETARKVALPDSAIGRVFHSLSHRLEQATHGPLGGSNPKSN